MDPDNLLSDRKIFLFLWENVYFWNSLDHRYWKVILHFETEILTKINLTSIVSFDQRGDMQLIE